MRGEAESAGTRFPQVPAAEGESRVAECAERKFNELMPANLLSSSSLLSGTVVVMLLLWLCGSALMTLRVGAKIRQAAISPARGPGDPDQMNYTETFDRDSEQSPAELVSQLQVMSEPTATGAASSLGLTAGQRTLENADPEMAFFAASADS